jgi:short-subunit dehydrogenase
MQRTEFTDKVVIITGASSGIGRAMALRLANEGAKLILAARRLEPLVKLASECRSAGGEAEFLDTNVTNEGSCRRLIEIAIAKFGRIDVLINNAGLGMHSLVVDVNDLSIFDRVMRTNYIGSVYCTCFALPFLQRTNGRIVAVSSLAGKSGVPGRSAYAASKHAMAGFFDSLRIELRDSGVSVTVAYPGFVDTGFGERALDANGEPLESRVTIREKVMSADRCAELILNAAAKRKREIVMTFPAKVGQWIRLVWPGLVDRIAVAIVSRRYSLSETSGASGA